MKKSIILLLILTLAYACQNPAKKIVIDSFALGTTYRIVICGDTTQGTMSLINEAFDKVNQSMSIYNPQSRLSKINCNESDSLDSMLEECITQALKISEQTNGMYDVTIKPLTDAWGFATKQNSGTPNVDSLLKFIGYKKIQIKDHKIIKANPSTQIDLNSIAKGKTVDIIAKVIQDLGHQNYLVEIGGEVFARGINTVNDHKWIIGIDKPIEGNMIAGAELVELIELSDMALATSGNYRRYYTDDQGNKIVHTINPKSGYSSPSNLLSATIVTENCTLADAYATAMMSLGLEKAMEFSKAHPNLIVYLIYSDTNGELKTYSSDNLKQLLNPNYKIR